MPWPELMRLCGIPCKGIEAAAASQPRPSQSLRVCHPARRGCAESNIDYVMTDTTTPYDFMLSRYITKRAQL